MAKCKKKTVRVYFGSGGGWKKIDVDLCKIFALYARFIVSRVCWMRESKRYLLCHALFYATDLNFIHLVEKGSHTNFHLLTTTINGCFMDKI